VDKDSATLGIPGEVAVALDGNHMEIVKYDTEDDHNFTMVSSTIRTMVSEILEKTITDFRR
jgi:hypothetical protein